MGLKDIYLDVMGSIVYWTIKIFFPKKHRDILIGWIAQRFGIFSEEEFETWMPKKLAEEQ